MTSEVKPRILLVEDNPGDVFLIRRALTKYSVDADLIEMRDGRAALEFVEKVDSDETIQAPDLALVDLNLPRATGSLILARLKKSHRCGSAPVIMMTSSDSPLDQETARRLGAHAYFPKPNDLNGYLSLGGIVRTMLESASSSNASLPSH
jgi:two-component system, chemotaxis family, response regulator Rcp1